MVVRRFLLAGFLAWWVWLFSANFVQAVEPFQTSMETVYTIDRDGKATVRHTVILTNTTSDQYAKQFTFSLGSRRTENIKAYGPSLPDIPLQLNEEGGVSVITLSFPDSVVGRGKKRTFTLDYVDLDGSQQIGSILEIGIPQSDPSLHVDEHRLTVYVPRDLGELSLLHPADSAQVTQDTAFTKIVFGPKVLQQSSVSMLFGSEQHYVFTLRYNLSNGTITPIVTQVALPPDTRYQRVWFESMEPKPSQIDVDADGNWIATYALEPKQQLVAVVKGGVTTMQGSHTSVPLPKGMMNDYLQPQTYWEVNDEKIRQLAQEYKTPEAIYTFLVHTFHYNYSRIDTLTTSRLGAKQAITAPNNALCMEFADSFIALARAAGIPARLVTGHAVTENNRLRPLGLVQDVLHAWPEYYDMEQQRWVPVDPTWGNTTGGVDYFHHFDFNHIAFAIQGLDSQKPYPAGLYKLPNQQSKDIYLEVVPLDVEPKRTFVTTVQAPWQTIFGFSDTLIFKVVNQSGVAGYGLPVQVMSTEGNRLMAESIIESILPFQTIEVPLQFDELPKKGDNIAISIEGNSNEHAVNYPRWVASVSRVAIALVVAAGFGIFVYQVRRLLVS